VGITRASDALILSFMIQPVECPELRVFFQRSFPIVLSSFSGFIMSMKCGVRGFAGCSFSYKERVSAPA
jgi:hypothetical protein